MQHNKNYQRLHLFLVRNGFHLCLHRLMPHLCKLHVFVHQFCAALPQAFIGTIKKRLLDNERIKNGARTNIFF